MLLSTIFYEAWVRATMSLNTVLLHNPDLNMNEFILRSLIGLPGYFQVIIRLLQHVFITPSSRLGFQVTILLTVTWTRFIQALFSRFVICTSWLEEYYKLEKSPQTYLCSACCCLHQFICLFFRNQGAPKTFRALLFLGPLHF